jgi:hypothetical protein
LSRDARLKVKTVDIFLNFYIRSARPSRFGAPCARSKQSGHNFSLSEIVDKKGVSCDQKAMLKTLIRVTVTNKFKNATYCCLRHFYQKVEMQNNSANQFLKSPATTEDNNRDALSNIRKWIPVDQSRKVGFIFTVLNYNILSQQLLECHNYLYANNDHSSLKWNNRLYNIVGEIFKVNPSILCCQVSETGKSLRHFHFLANVLQSIFISRCALGLLGSRA